MGNLFMTYQYRTFAATIVATCLTLISVAGAQTSEEENAIGVRQLIADIATGVIRQGDGKVKRPKEENVGEPEINVGPTNPDGTASGFQCQTKKVSLEQEAEEFLTLNPTQEWLYAGALLQGATISGGTPTFISAGRGPGRIALAVQAGSSGSLVEDVPEMTRTNVLDALNTILSSYDAGTPGEFALSMKKVENQLHLEAMLGMNVTGNSFSAGASLSVSSNREKTKLLVRLSQKFYTVVFEPPRFPEQVFSSDVTVEEAKRWMGPGNPPVFISSVNYGRMLFALLESDLSEDEVKAAFNAGYEGSVSASGEGSAEFSRRLANTSVSVISFGASASGGLAAGADVAESSSFEGIYSFLRDSGNFGPENPGVPISYQMRSLYDSRPVRLAATTEYTKTDCKPVAFGCDKVAGSTKTIDRCGVCGGNNACETPCEAKTITLGNDHVFVYFGPAENRCGR